MRGNINQDLLVTIGIGLVLLLILMIGTAEKQAMERKIFAEAEKRIAELNKIKMNRSWS